MNALFKDFTIPSGIKVISFDIFDTLILNPFEKKSDVFRFLNGEVEKIIGKKVNFKKLRKEAEAKARRKIYPTEEITLQEIYKYMQHIPEEFKTQIRLLEIQTGIKLSYPRPAGQKIYKKIKNSGLTIIATSDTYLDFQTISDLLSKNNFEFSELFISSEFKKTKRVGTLFDAVIEKMGCCPEEILHIGDNEKADISNAGKRKLHTFYLPAPLKEFYKNKIYRKIFFRRNNCLLTSALIGIYSEKLDCGDLSSSDSLLNGKLYNAGFICFGGLLFAFTQWVYQGCLQDNIKNLYFLARDGFIMKKSMEILYPSTPFNTYYLEVSRKSLTPFSTNSIQEVLKLYSSGHRPTTVKTFIEQRLGCNISKISTENLHTIGFNSFEEKVGRKRDYVKVKKIVEFYAEDILQRNKIDQSSASSFLLPLLQKKNIALCDIGYKGTMQRILSSIMPEKQIFGFYFLTNHKALRPPKMRAFWQENLKKWKFIIISSFIKFLEASFLNAPHGTITGYTEKGEPIKDSWNNVESMRLKANAEIWKGAFDIQNIIKERFGTDMQKLTYNTAKIFTPFLSLAMQPKTPDAKVFEGICFENKSDGAGYQNIIKNKLWRPGYLAVYHPYFSKIMNFFTEIILRVLRLK